MNNLNYIAAYLALGWVVGVMLFYFAFMDHDVSMGGNSGGAPLPYFIVRMPSTPQALMYIVGMALWPLTLVAAAVLAVVRTAIRIAESKNLVLPCIVKWTFGWPIFLVMAMCGKCVEHEKD